MSPTVFRWKKYRFYFFSREEPRVHVHITCSDGEAKFWIEPVVALANYSGLKKRQLRELQEVVEEQKNAIEKAWKSHFKV